MKTSQAQSIRADRVKQLLDELDFDAIVETIKQELIDELIKSAAHESKLREDNYRAIWILNQVEQAVRSILHTGKFAKIELKREKNNGKRR